MSATIKLGATGGKILFSTSGTAGNGTPATGFGGLYYGSDEILRLITDTGTITEYTPDFLHPPSGSSGTSGNSRSSGTSGNGGVSGTSGTSGTGNAGTNGISGISPIGPTGPGFSYGANSVTSNLAGSLNNSALASNTTGSSNVAIGQSALNQNTNGVTNVALGYNALSANNTASDNIQLGRADTSFLTTGNRNVQLGVQNHVQSSSSDNVTLSTEGSVGAIGNPKNLNTLIGFRSRSKGDNNVQIGNVIVDATGNNRTQIGQQATVQSLSDAIILGYPHDCVIHSSTIQSGSYSADRRLPITIEGVTYYLLLET